jgi:hypothetical protein
LAQNTHLLLSDYVYLTYGAIHGCYRPSK